jgi:N-hydroxyarylamine O-acetyltransferase
MRESQLDAYLARIGAARPRRADAAALRDLQLRHLRAVPFENLSIHLGEAIELAEDALLDKIVTRRRGGFCYELNGAFAALLTGLGYRVRLMSARVAGRDGFGPPFDHLALRVDLGEPWLVDVGFGRFSSFPLRLDLRTGQADPGGVFRVLDTDDGDLDVLRDGEPEYRLEQRPRALTDFVPTCWFQQTSPDSHFTRSLVCSRLTDSGRITLSGRKLVSTTVDGARDERVLDSDEELLAVYRDQFGIVLDRLPPVPVPAPAPG